MCTHVQATCLELPVACTFLSNIGADDVYGRVQTLVAHMALSVGCRQLVDCGHMGMSVIESCRGYAIALLEDLLAKPNFTVATNVRFFFFLTLLFFPLTNI